MHLKTSKVSATRRFQAGCSTALEPLGAGLKSLVQDGRHVARRAADSRWSTLVAAIATGAADLRHT